MGSSPFLFVTLGLVLVRIGVWAAAIWASTEMLTLVKEDRLFLLATQQNGVRMEILDGQRVLYRLIRIVSIVEGARAAMVVATLVHMASRGLALPVPSTALASQAMQVVIAWLIWRVVRHGLCERDRLQAHATEQGRPCP